MRRELPTLKEMETFLIITALFRFAGDKRKMSAALGVSTKTIKRRIRELDLSDAIQRGMTVAQKPEISISNGLPYHGLEELLDSFLWEKYWGRFSLKSLGKITFNKLVQTPGPERAKILRTNPKIRKMYAEKTQRA